MRRVFGVNRYLGVEVVVVCKAGTNNVQSKKESIKNVFHTLTIFKNYHTVGPCGPACMFQMHLRSVSYYNDIVKKSSFLDTFETGDLILADRGFTITFILYAKQINLK